MPQPAVLCIALLLFVSTQPLHGQSPAEVFIGPEIPNSKKLEAPKNSLGSDDHGFYIERYADEMEVTLERYGNDLTLGKTSTFKPTFSGQPLRPWYVFENPTGISILARGRSEGTDSVIFLCSPVDPHTLVPTNAWVELGRVDTKGRKPTVSVQRGRRGTALVFGNKERGTETQFGSVTNGTERVFYTDYAMSGEEHDVYDLTMVDADMREKWSIKLALDETEDEFDHWGTELDENGVVYLHGRKVAGGGKEVVGGLPNYVHRIYGVDDSGIRMDASVSLGERFIKSGHLEVNGSALTLAGFYADDASMEARGTYIVEIDSRSGTIIQQRIVEFPLALFTQLYGSEKGPSLHAKFATSKRNGIEMLKLRSVGHRDPGGYRIIGEIRWESQHARMTTKTGASPSVKYKRTSYTDMYHSEQMLVLDFSKDLELENTAVIQKKQEVAREEEFSSALTIPGSNDRHLFVFNDHVANQSDLDLANAQPKKWLGKNGYIALVELSETGVQTRTNILDIDKDQLAIDNTFVIKINEHEHVMLCRFTANERWLKIKW